MWPAADASGVISSRSCKSRPASRAVCASAAGAMCVAFVNTTSGLPDARIAAITSTAPGIAVAGPPPRARCTSVPSRSNMNPRASWSRIGAEATCAECALLVALRTPIGTLDLVRAHDRGGQLGQAVERGQPLSAPPRERDPHRRLGRLEAPVDGSRDAQAARALVHDHAHAGALGDRGDDPLLLRLGARDRRPRRLAEHVLAD